MNNMKVYLVGNAKLENPYIKEWVEHYLDLGIDKIIIYDNNDIDGEKISDIINSDKVEIIEDYRGKYLTIDNIWYQDYMYIEAYKKYSNECDWMCFFDIDEFLILDNKYKNIKEFLSDNIFNDYESIKVVWKIYGDNNLVYYEDKPLKERFTKLALITDDVQVKSIIRTKKDIKWINCHGNTEPQLKKCNTKGEKTEYLYNDEYNVGNLIINPIYENACLNHYRFKTIEEYINTKYKISTSYKNNICGFFDYNEKTPEKLEYLKSIGIDYE